MDTEIVLSKHFFQQEAPTLFLGREVLSFTAVCNFMLVDLVLLYPTLGVNKKVYYTTHKSEID
jgi:hypothetical protein